MSIFTRIYFANTQRPEISANDPFAEAVSLLGNITVSSPAGQIYPAFRPLDNWDVVLQKVRYYAGAGNSLEEILASQKIDTVILVSGPQRKSIGGVDLAYSSAPASASLVLVVPDRP